MASLIERTAQKRKIMKKIKKRRRQKSVEAVREEEVKLRGVGFVKEVGFKPGEILYNTDCWLHNNNSNNLACIAPAASISKTPGMASDL